MKKRIRRKRNGKDKKNKQDEKKTERRLTEVGRKVKEKGKNKNSK